MVVSACANAMHPAAVSARPKRPKVRISLMESPEIEKQARRRPFPQCVLVDELKQKTD
jgi:hypothetical protein